MKAVKGKDGKYSIHCEDCGRFLAAGEPMALPDDLFPKGATFPEGAGGPAGQPILSVADAICAVHGIVEKGAFWSPQKAEQD